jgi:glycosyltransferase 2 family protein
MAAVLSRLSSVARGRKASLVTRLVVSLSLLVFVLSLADLDQIEQVLARIEYPWFFVAAFLVMCDRAMMAYKWHLLLHAKRMAVSFWRALEIYLISGFVGVVLPSGIGADIYRVHYTSRSIGKVSHVASSVIMERLIGVAAASVFAVIGLSVMSTVSNKSVVGHDVLLTILVTLAVMIAGFTMSMTAMPFQFVERMLLRWAASSVAAKLASFREAYLEYGRYKTTLTVFFVLSVVEQGLFVLITYVGALAIGIRMEMVFFLGIVPVCQIIKRIPISINSIGVQEGLFVYFFTQVGMSATEALSLSILTRIAQWLATLAGGALYVMDSSMHVDAKSLPVNRGS